MAPLATVVVRPERLARHPQPFQMINVKTTSIAERPVASRPLLWAAFALVLTFLLPNHYEPWTSFHSEFGAALAFTPIMLWAAWRRGPLPALAVAALVWAVVPMLQMLLGQIFFAGDGWMAALYLSGAGMVVVAGARWQRNEPATAGALDGLAPIWVALLAAALLSVGIALHQWLGLIQLGIFGAELPPGERAFANLGQPNQFATLLLMGLAALLALFEAGRVHARIALVGAAFLVIGMVLTGSRSVLLALAWLWPSYWLMKGRCRMRTQSVAVVGVSLFYALAMALWPSLNEILLLPSGRSTVLDRLDSPGVRTVYWQSMLDALSRAPWAGYGWSQIGLAQTATALDYPATHTSFDSAHNLILDLLLWNGLPLGVAAVGGLVVWFVWQVRQCRDSQSWSALIAIGFVFSHAMVEYPLNYAFFLLPVGFLMGALSAAHPSTADKKCDRLALPLQRASFALVGVFALAMVVKIGWEYPVWEQDWRNVRYQEARIGDPIFVDLPHPILLTQLRELMRLSRTDVKPGMTDAELEWIRQVSGRFGFPSLMYRYALALGLNHRPAEAVLALRRLCTMHSRAKCVAAEANWLEMGHDKFPELTHIAFPRFSGEPVASQAAPR